MSETRDLVREAAERLFEKHCGADTMRRADCGEFPQALCAELKKRNEVVEYRTQPIGH